MTSILVRITVPEAADEDYRDVAPELLLEDAQQTPEAFEWEIVAELEKKK